MAHVTSDVNMSSEGSVSSRLRQFGLYKTIDSRTEEFLKLSRKRQIRRGCACAVVSTAITVTIVVGALLVYKYGFRKDIKTPAALRLRSWFTAVDNSEIASNKKKDNDNNENNKLLPLILKALDQRSNVSRNCICSNNSVPPVLTQIYDTIQKLLPKDIRKTTNTTEVRHTSENDTAVKVQRRSSITSIRPFKYTTATSTRKETSSLRTTRKLFALKVTNVTYVSNIKSHLKDKDINSKSKLKKFLPGQKKYKGPNNTTHKKEATLKRSDFKISDRIVTTTTYKIIEPNVYTERTKLVNSTSTIKPDDNKIVKDILQYKKTLDFDYDDDYKDSDHFNEIGHLLPKSKQYYNTHEKSVIFDYMDSLSKIYGKSFFESKPHSKPKAETTMKPFDLKKYFANDKLGSLVKLTATASTTTESLRTVKPIQLFKANVIKEVQSITENKSVEPLPSKKVRPRELFTSSTMKTGETPYTRPNIINNGNNEKTDEYLLFPVILLIYEYAIAVESSLVQRLYSYGNDSSINGTDDNPVADRLDRSYFGFDQDYYERMPLLVNAMQENHYVDPFVENIPSKRARLLRNQTKTSAVDYKTTSIRRTSPRPFIFELRSPTPTPFSKTFGSKSWVESYRNAQRLQNLQQVIQYLEKTINAKFGDLYELPSSSSTHIAFSGVYVNPSKDSNSKDPKPTSPTLDLLLQSSNKVETRINHVSDPLFSFKPDNPGDVNLLADGFLRFAPTPTLVKEKTTTIPMFRPISYRNKQDNNDKNVVDSQASEIKNIESSTIDKPTSFSVMLNYVPTKTTINTDYLSSDGTSSAMNKVYFTTSRPVRVHFKRKSSGPVRRMYTPRALKKPTINRIKNPAGSDILRKSNLNKETTMIVHVNLYPQRTVVKEMDNVTENKQDYTTTTELNTDRFLTQTPESYVPQVEDHHVGSSGIIPVESRTVPPQPPPPVITSIPSFQTTSSTTTETYSWPTNPPDVVKFSPEDARVPDHYHQLREMENNYSHSTNPDSVTFNPEDAKIPDQYKQLREIEINNSSPTGTVSRTNSGVAKFPDEYRHPQEKERSSNSNPFGSNNRHFDIDNDEFSGQYRHLNDMEMTDNAPSRINRRNYRDSIENEEVEPSTLVVKLKNELKSDTTTTQESISEEIEDEESETTTVQTYVPQINGHYRSVNQNSRTINDWFDKENDSDRKRRLKMTVTGLKKPTYVEIKRNNTNINHNDDDENEE